MPQPIRESDAVTEIIAKMKRFRSIHSKKALQDAVANGAFHSHDEYGDLVYALRDREFEDRLTSVPHWVSEMFDAIAEDMMMS